MKNKRRAKGRIQFLTAEFGWINVSTWPYDRYWRVKPGFRVRWNVGR